MRFLHLTYIAPLALLIAFQPISAATPRGPAPEARVARLDELVQLTPEQRTQAASVFAKERDALLGSASSDPQQSLRDMETRQRSRAEIRAILTVDQRKVYDRTNTGRGGGLTIPEPQTKVERLDKEVGLTPAQKQTALAVFSEEFESLLALNPQDRMEAGMPIRQVAQDQIRALLTPEQLSKQSGVREAELKVQAEQTLAMKNALRESALVSAKVGNILTLAQRSASGETTPRGRKGEGVFTVTGERGSAVFSVKWERQTATASITVVGIVETEK